MTFERDITEAFDRLHTRSAERTWIYGLLGYQVDGNYMIELPNQPGAVYVLLGYDGDKGLAIAQNRIGADTTQGGQRIKMKRENGQLLIREAEFLAAGGGGGSGIDHLSDLVDVSVTSPSTGDKLVWSATLGKWVNGAASAVTTHALGGSLSPHTGLLDDGQAPQFLMTNGSRALTNDLTVSAFVTIDGVDLDVHASNPDAHHHRATVGNGLTINSVQAIAFDFDTNPGLEFNGTHLRVKVDSTLVRASTGVGVDVSHNFTSGSTWTGTHQFNVAPQLNANLNFIGADRSITSGSGVDVTIDLGGDLLLASSKRFVSPDFIDGIPISGFSIFVNTGGDRQLTINTIKSDSIHTRLLIYDGTRIDIGEEYWGKSVGVVHDDFVTPASIGGTVYIYFEDSPRITGAIFSNNDWLLLQYIDGGASGATFNSGYIWGQVSGYTHAGNDPDGRGYQRWTFTLRHGDLSQLIEKHNVAIDFGASGQGYVHLSTLADADGPWIRIGTWSGSDPFTAGNNQNHAQIGNLAGVVDTALNPTGYGLYSDNAYLHGIVRTPNAILSDKGLVVFAESLSGLDPFDAYKFAKDDLTEYGGLYGYWTAAFGGTPEGHQLVLSTEPTASGNGINVLAQADSTGDASVFLGASREDDTNLTAISLERSSRVGSLVTVWGDTIFLQANAGVGGFIKLHGDLRPEFDLAYDLGSASFRWDNLYVNHLNVAGSISGATIDGQTWSYAASMVIDALSSSNTTVSVTNSGAGRADLDVDRNITLGGTIDGVDLSAHVANASAHHAPVTAGSGIDVVSQVVSVDASVVRTTRQVTAGAGLTDGGYLSGDISLNVGAGQGIVVNADNVAVSLGTGSGLATVGGLVVDPSIAGAGLAMTPGVGVIDVVAVPTGGLQVNPGTIQVKLPTTSGLNTDVNGLYVKLPTPSGLTRDTTGLYIPDAIAGNGLVFPSKILAVGQGVGMVVGLNDVALGPPSDVSVVSANSVTGTTHTHNIVSSSDVTTPTLVASVLESTSSGGLTLGNLTVKGAVNVLNGGDLTVGANIFFVDNSLASVGINRAPDGQFALDVSGAIRGDLIVGKHAIQLKGVLLLSHFDGGDPYATNMTGETSGHMGQVGTLVGGAIFRPGHFYKALQCAPAKTNLCQNPSFEEDLTNWSIANGGSWTRTITDAFVGKACVKGVTSSNSQSLVNTSLTGLTVGAVYTVSAWIRRETLTGTSRIFASTSTFANQTYSQTVTADQGWTRVSVDYTVEASRTLRVGFQNVTNGTAYFDAVQIEASYLSPYLDGSLSDDPGLVGSGHNWTIDDKNGSSIRTDGKLTYPTTGNIHADRGTIMAWIYSEDNTGSSGQGIVDVSSSWPKLALYLNASGTAQGIWGTGANFANGPSAAGSLFGTGWHHVAFTWSIYTHEAVCYVDGKPGTVNTAFTTTAPTLSSVITVGQLGSLSGEYFNGLIDDLVILDHVMTPTEILAVYESDAPVFAESSVFTFRATPKGLVWADEEGLWMRNTSGFSVLGVYGGDAPTKSWGGAVMQQGDLLVGDASRGATLLWDDSLGTLQLGKATAGATNLFLSGTDLSFRVNATERISLSGSGIMEINDSTGAAVFTFNASAGAEFTKPLTLGPLGGIYQGSGTFSVPITGLKLFNVSGTGKLAGYNGGVEQVKLDTDGRMYAGAGAVRLDATGIGIVAGSAVTQVTTYSFLTSGLASIGGLSGFVGTTAHTIDLLATPVTGHVSSIQVQAQSVAGKQATARLSAYDQTHLPDVTVDANNNVVAVTPRLTIVQASLTAAQPVLLLDQDDDSEAFIDFEGNSSFGTTTPVSTAALGLYQGKIRISVNGTFFWLPIYF